LKVVRGKKEGKEQSSLSRVELKREFSGISTPQRGKEKEEFLAPHQKGGYLKYPRKKEAVRYYEGKKRQGRLL